MTSTPSEIDRLSAELAEAKRLVGESADELEAAATEELSLVGGATDIADTANRIASELRAFLAKHSPPPPDDKEATQSERADALINTITGDWR